MIQQKGRRWEDEAECEDESEVEHQGPGVQQVDELLRCAMLCCGT